MVLVQLVIANSDVPKLSLPLIVAVFLGIDVKCT